MRQDSPLEEDGFELLVPRRGNSEFETAPFDLLAGDRGFRTTAQSWS